jgi:error-prone DNA polymerase
MTGPRSYVELQCTSHFSFLRGASSCDEFFVQAAALGIEALAIVDRNSVAGIVRAHEAAKATGVRLIVGCRLDLADGMPVLVYPTDRPAYGRLCRLLSLGKKRGGKAKCHLLSLMARGLSQSWRRIMRTISAACGCGASLRLSAIARLWR